MIVLSVAIGGAIGSLLRYYLSTLNFLSNSSFPVSTFLVNVIGSFANWYIFFFLKDSNNDYLKSFLMIGFLGGLQLFLLFQLRF